MWIYDFPFMCVFIGVFSSLAVLISIAFIQKNRLFSYIIIFSGLILGGGGLVHGIIFLTFFPEAIGDIAIRAWFAYLILLLPLVCIIYSIVLCVIGVNREAPQETFCAPLGQESPPEQG